VIRRDIAGRLFILNETRGGVGIYYKGFPAGSERSLDYIMHKWLDPIILK
jgi:hypothetical protein